MPHSTQNIGLRSLLEKADKGELQIPQFQRGYVWNKAQRVKLAASLLKGYPIGSFLLMEDDNGYASTVINGVESQLLNDGLDIILVLDGQQRITTSYQILYQRGDYNYYFNYDKFSEELQTLREALRTDDHIEKIIDDNIEDWIVIESSARNRNFTDQIQNGLFPLGIIINEINGISYTKWLAEYNFNKAEGDRDKFTRLTSIQSTFVGKILENITSYQASEILIGKNTPPSIVCTIFETINSTGVKLNVFDLLVAKCYPDNFLLRTELENAYDENPIFNDFDPNKDEFIGLAIIKIISLKAKSTCKKADLLSLNVDTIRKEWAGSVSDIASCLEYVKNNYGILSLKYLPYKDIIPVLSVFRPNDIVCDITKNKVNKWYWACIFSSFFDNAADTKSAKSIKELNSWIKNGDIPEVFHLLSDDFNYIKKLSPQNAQYKAILNIIINNNSKDFINKGFIKESNFNRLNDHHIFPQKFLSLNGIHGNDANTILNRTIIENDTNQTIKAYAPSVYLQEHEIEDSILEAHYIPIEIKSDLFTPDNYNKFLDNRKSLIVEKIKELINIQ